MATLTLSKEKLFAYLIVDDIQVPEDVLQKAQDDSSLSFYQIGLLCEDKKKYDKAIEWYRLSANKGHADSQFKLGKMHDDGPGVSVNYKLAMEWYLKACNGGCVSAANNIAALYYYGHDVNQNDKIALKWFLKAADSEVVCAQYNVGLIYENGCGVKSDKQYALEWYEKSSEQGDEDAKVQVKALNDQGFYTDDRQKKHLQTEKELKAQKSKVQSLENQLKALQHKQLASDSEIKLLKQENEVLKLKSHMNTKDQVAMKEDIIQQLIEGFSKTITHWVSPNTAKDSNTDDEKPGNDICYDQ